MRAFPIRCVKAVALGLAAFLPSTGVLAADNVHYTDVATVLPVPLSPMDRFAWSVDIDGDVLVATRVDFTPDDGVDSSGVYVYRRNIGTGDWIFESQLRPRDTLPVNLNPVVAAISGDFVVIGTPAGGAGQEGRAYLWGRDPTSGRWNQVRVLQSSRPAANNGFGAAVAIDRNTLVVGSSGEIVGDDRIGAAHVFQRGSTGWRHARRIVAPSGATPVAGFGDAVAIEGSRLIVGAGFSTADNGRPEAGLAFVFSRNQGGDGRWGQVARLQSPSPDEADGCGAQVAISGSLAAVACTTPGEVWIHRLGTTTPVQPVRLVDPYDPERERLRNFGMSMDFKNARLVIGARASVPELAGLALVYDCAAVSPPTCTLHDTLSQGVANGRFGWDVAIDANDRIAVAGSDGTASWSDGGAVFVLSED